MRYPTEYTQGAYAALAALACLTGMPCKQAVAALRRPFIVFTGTLFFPGKPDLQSRREPHHTTVRDAEKRRHARKKMEQLLSVLYGASGIAASALYVPQIIKYHRDPEARMSISLLSWGGWIAIAIVTILYALYVVKSPLFAAVAALNVSAQLVVLCYGVNARLERSRVSRVPASASSKELASASLTTATAGQ